MKDHEFETAWYEWGIKFKCDCGYTNEMDDIDENPKQCGDCHRKYKFDTKNWKLSKL